MAEKKKPNILVIWGDDIGITNLSCYSHGLMGYQTPNIDRVAKEGMMFTDSYERADITSNSYYDWFMSKAHLMFAATAIVGEFLKTFKDFPPRQKAAAFNLDEVMRKMAEHPSSS